MVLWTYGVDQSMLINFLFWFGETKLDASGSVLGLSAFIGTISALPVFIWAGKVIGMVGAEHILSFTMMSFAVSLFLDLKKRLRLHSVDLKFK